MRNEEMSNDFDDLDALFDSVVAQREGAATPEPVPAPVEPQAPAPLPEPVAQPQALDPQSLAARLPPDYKPMYDRLGGIVRELHDALRELGHERSLFDAVHEVFDSQERLKYIASLTEQAANKVLNAVDESLPAQESQTSQAQSLSQRWDAMFEGKLSVEEFKQLAADSRAFSSAVAANSEAEKNRLMDIMMAQDFQDITGQIIKKVVNLTGNLQTQLTQLLYDFAPTVPRSVAVDLLSGPNVPTAALAQDDVDSLLGELGF
jgi:chemotaxis protein CheZ